MLKRKICDTFLRWKEENDGRIALLVESACRVRKPTIVEEFAKSEHASYVLVDFSLVTDDFKQTFLDTRNDLDSFFPLSQLLGAMVPSRLLEGFRQTTSLHPGFEPSGPLLPLYLVATSCRAAARMSSIAQAGSSAPKIELPATSTFTPTFHGCVRLCS